MELAPLGPVPFIIMFVLSQHNSGCSAGFVSMVGKTFVVQSSIHNEGGWRKGGTFAKGHNKRDEKKERNCTDKARNRTSVDAKNDSPMT